MEIKRTKFYCNECRCGLMNKMNGQGSAHRLCLINPLGHSTNTGHHQANINVKAIG